VTKNGTNICSKLWTDLYINFQEQTFGHCCKMIHYPVNALTIEKMGKDVFWKNEHHHNDRKAMVEENRLPNSCKFCIDAEPDSIRHVWNTWNTEFIDYNRDRLMAAKETNYIELDVGRKCDMACVYCGPWSSSTWAKELGVGYKNDDEEYAEMWREEVMKALREYVISLPKRLKVVFNLLGGEPLLLPYTYDMLEFLAEVCAEANFDNKPTIMVTSNLNCKTKLLDRLLETIEKTSDTFNWQLSVSIEDVGERAERVRRHLNWNRFEKNLKAVRQTDTFIYLTMTVNILSLPFLDEYFDWAFQTLGHDRYGQNWDFTMNSVQDQAQDIVYCPPDLVDIEKLIAAYERNIADVNPYYLAKRPVILQHIRNMGGQLGKRVPDEKFFHFWELQRIKRGLDYTDMYPLPEIFERYEDPR
jgi:organic radical activating enzyme